MTKLRLSAFVLLFGLVAGPAMAQDITVGRAGPMTGSICHVRHADEERRRTGRRRHQCRGRRAGQEAQARDRRRRLRSQAGALGRAKSSPGWEWPSSSAIIARRRRSRRRTPISTAAFCRSRRPRPIRCSPSAACGTRSAPAAATTSRARSPATISPRHFKDKNIAILQRQDDLRQRPRRRDEEGAQRRRREGEAVRGLQRRATRTSPRSSRSSSANAIDVVYVGGYHTEAGLIVRQMRGAGPDERC